MMLEKAPYKWYFNLIFTPFQISIFLSNLVSIFHVCTFTSRMDATNNKDVATTYEGLLVQVVICVLLEIWTICAR